MCWVVSGKWERSCSIVVIFLFTHSCSMFMMLSTMLAHLCHDPRSLWCFVASSTPPTFQPFNHGVFRPIHRGEPGRCRRVRRNGGDDRHIRPFDDHLWILMAYMAYIAYMACIAYMASLDIPKLRGFRILAGIFCHFSHVTSTKSGKGKRCSLWTAGEKTGLGLGRMVGLRSAEVSSGSRGGQSSWVDRAAGCD